MDDKRRAWREQEQQLVERWHTAEENYRTARAGLTAPQPGEAAGDSAQKADAARVILEGMRKQIARLKAEFSTGKRY
jgi:hypothetical protein